MLIEYSTLQSNAKVRKAELISPVYKIKAGKCLSFTLGKNDYGILLELHIRHVKWHSFK